MQTFVIEIFISKKINKLYFVLKKQLIVFEIISGSPYSYFLECFRGFLNLKKKKEFIVHLCKKKKYINKTDVVDGWF